MTAPASTPDIIVPDGTPVNDAVFAAPTPTDPGTVVATVADTAPAEKTPEQVDLEKFYSALDAWRERLDRGWAYERIEYKGDNLAVRKPLMQALAAFQLSSSKFISDDRKNDIVGLFVDQHMGRESYDHMMARLMDPDDPDYTTESIADVMGKLVELAVEDIKEQAKAEATSKS